MFDSKMYNTMLVVLVIVFVGSPVYALFDGFEDGDYTSNPSWILTNPYYGEAIVAADPDESNLALKIHGTEEAHYMLDTPVEIPFAGFDASIEFLATAGDYHPLIYVKNNDVQFGVACTLDPAKPQHPSPRLYVVEQAPGVENMHMTTTNEIPLYTWVRLRMWHDPESNVVYGQVSLVSDDSLIGEISFTPSTDISMQNPTSTFRMGAEEWSWQYIDNVTLTTIPESTTEVTIDIKPGSYPNTINLGSQGVVPIAILSTADFDATTVDPDTVELAGAGVSVRGKSNKSMAHEEDVNGDGLLDLVVQVETANLDPGSFQAGWAILTGSTYDGQAIEGWDEITIVPPEQ